MTQAPPSPDTTTSAERALIGAILYSPKTLDYLEGFNTADYKDPAYEAIHDTAMRLHQDGKPVEPWTVAEALAKAQPNRSPSTADLHALVVHGEPASAHYYAETVTREAQRRRIVATAAKLRELVAVSDPETVLEEAQAELDAIKNSVHTQGVTFIGDDLMDTIASLEHAPRFVETPWPALNSMIGGFRPGALYVVGARPASGKSIFALQSATTLAQHGGVAFISLEMSRYDLQKRALSFHGKIDGQHLQNHNLTEWDWEQITRVAPQMQHLPIAILDRSVTIQQARRFVTSVHRRRPLAGIVLDYLQILDPPPGDQRSKQDYIAAMSRQLKMLAMDLDIPVIVLSQLSRKSEMRDGGQPKLSDLRDSGAIEQDADAVILLHRDLDESPYDVKMIIAKNRRGGIGQKTFDFRGHYSAITEPGTDHR